MAYRFQLEVPEAVHEDAKIVVGNVRDARIVVERHPRPASSDPEDQRAELTISCHSLDVVDALYRWMREVGLPTGVYLEAYGGGRIDLGQQEPRALRRAIQSNQYWMETTVPRITHIDETFMEGGARVSDVPYGGRMARGMAMVPAETQVPIGAVDHLAVRVRDMARAEAFYRDFFGMAVAYRARRDDERWQHLDATFDWTESIHTGVTPELVRLENGPLSLVLINAGMGAVLHENRVAYISVSVPRDTLNELRGRALFNSYTTQEDSPRAFRFVDPFGVAWQLVAS